MAKNGRVCGDILDFLGVIPTFFVVIPTFFVVIPTFFVAIPTFFRGRSYILGKLNLRSDSFKRGLRMEMKVRERYSRGYGKGL